ncbi:FitA-like ribbon-helix-helix domain-containing protein [Gracilimonas amylolytica]|uniref:FitA-like ribbon-helix-helix domain-containing protein n=1 Tax=Gracilimonas amylolytica TaxID=1749045 RepID=UPI000CD80210|nr:Arc family DNA-binding protein [Gracilimonas amylolytica]
MANITVKNIPKPIYEKLKKQAAARHRSMNSEIIACLEKAVEPNRVTDNEILYQARLARKMAQKALNTEDIQDAIDKGRS